MENTVYLVSCVGKKRSTPAKAKDLYASDWFTKARQYVEAHGGDWFILSAELGLVDPEDEIAPYEKTLNAMGVRERREWAERVKGQMAQRLPRVDRIVVLAGQRYRENLMDFLHTHAHRVEVPMEGLKIGQQLQWLGTHLPG